MVVPQVYKGNPIKVDDLGVPPIYGNTHMYSMKHIINGVVLTEERNPAIICGNFQGTKIILCHFKSLAA